MSQDKKAINERGGTKGISCICSAVVKGRDERSGMFEETARVINLSANGLFMLVPRALTAGDRLQISIPLPIGSPESSASNQLQIEGTVVREEPYGNGEYGIALHFRSHRFVESEYMGLGLTKSK